MQQGNEVIDLWLKHQEYRGFSAATIRRRTWTMGQWVAHAPSHVGNRNLSDVEQFVVRWTNSATRRAILGDLRSFYRFGFQRGYLPHDPTALAETPRRPKRRPTPISAENIQRLLADTAPPRRTMIALAALAGLRVSEVAALETAHVNLRDGVLTVRNGKGGKDRHVPISSRLAGELSGWPQGRYFPGLEAEKVSYAIRRELRRLGIPGRPHDLRASFCTELARISGGNLVLVAELVGHESVHTTQGYVDYPQNAAALVNAMFAA
jgi:integrase/recombinase XerD